MTAVVIGRAGDIVSPGLEVVIVGKGREWG